MDIEIIKLIISIGALIISILTLCGFGVYMSLNTKKRFERKEAEKASIEKAKADENNKKLMDLISKALDDRFAPVISDLSSISANLDLNTQGTVTLLRNDMKKALDSYKIKGFASSTDKAAWMELYTTYGRLGGNHFREYIDQWKEEVNDLPLEPKKKTSTKKKTTKQRLNEKQN